MGLQHKIAIGVDIGGSHITAGMVDLSGKILNEGSVIRQHINSGSSARDIIKSWALVIISLLQKTQGSHVHIGLAMPGPFDYGDGVSLMKDNGKFEALYGMNVRDMLAQETGLPKNSFRFRNDAEAFLEGEIFCGAAQGYDSVVALTLGTGLGSASHFDNITADANLWNCPFLDATAETYLSTRWFLGRYKELTGVQIKDVKSLSMLIPSDPNATLVFDEFGNNLSLFINKLIGGYHPGAIILGGNIALAFALFESQLMMGLTALNRDKIKLSKLGELAALVGAACLWNEVELTV